MFLDRIGRLDPTLHAYVTVTADLARESADDADRALRNGDDRPLLGVPYALKDNIATRGIRTTANSRALAYNTPRDDARVVARLRGAGAVLLGKATLHEFAYGWPVRDGVLATGRNPWNVARIPGGSSSGCAVAVAGGLATFAIGTDTGGSIRAPSSNCGIVGLKPTNDTVSLEGVIPVAPELDTVGPMCRTVDDAAAVLSAISENSPVALPVPHVRPGFRVGVATESIARAHPIDPEIRTALEAAASVLRDAGAEVRAVELPAPARWQAIVNPLLSPLYLYHREGLRVHPELYSEGLRGLIEPLARHTADDVAKARGLRRGLRVEIAALFESVDVVLMPVEFYLPLSFEASEAERAAGSRPPSLRSLWNLLGNPAVSVPCGFSRDGLPIGMQLAGRVAEDGLLLQVAEAYQRATDWHRRRAPAIAGPEDAP